MTDAKPTTATDILSLSTAPSRRWGAWVAGIAATLGAAIAAVALLGASPAPASEPTAKVAIIDRTEEIHSRADEIRARMQSVRDRLANRPQVRPEQPKQPRNPKQPRQPKQPKQPEINDGPGPITVDPNCTKTGLGCLKHE